MEWQHFLREWKERHPRTSHRVAQKKASKEYQKNKLRQRTMYMNRGGTKEELIERIYERSKRVKSRKEYGILFEEA